MSLITIIYQALFFSIFAFFVIVVLSYTAFLIRRKTVKSRARNNNPVHAEKLRKVKYIHNHSLAKAGEMQKYYYNYHVLENYRKEKQKHIYNTRAKRYDIINTKSGYKTNGSSVETENRKTFENYYSKASY